MQLVQAQAKVVAGPRSRSRASVRVVAQTTPPPAAPPAVSRRSAALLLAGSVLPLLAVGDALAIGKDYRKALKEKEARIARMKDNASKIKAEKGSEAGN